MALSRFGSAERLTLVGLSGASSAQPALFRSLSSLSVTAFDELASFKVARPSIGGTHLATLTLDWLVSPEPGGHLGVEAFERAW